MEITNWCYDEPKRTDYLWNDYFEWWESWESKKIADLMEWKIFNQNANKDTLKACSAYWLTYIYNWYQVVEYEKNWLIFEQDDPRWKWRAFQEERWMINSGASLQDMLDFFKRRWLIDWYVKCTTAKEVSNAINNWFLIYTGSAKCNWTKAGKSWKFEYDENGAKHCFSIIDVDWTDLIGINSFWDKRWTNWYFRIPFENYKDLYSTYAVIDHDDSGKLETLKFNAEYEKAIELWITNWTRPNDTSTRKETAVMILRMYKKLLEDIKK